MSWKVGRQMLGWSSFLLVKLRYQTCGEHVDLDDLEALKRFFYQDLVRSSPAAGPLMMILWDSPWGLGMKILVSSLCADLVEILVKASKRSLQCMILYRSLWEDLVEILVLNDLVQVLVRRPCGDPVEILLQRSFALRSWRCSALALVWPFFWDAHRKFLFESFKIFYI